MLYDIIKSRRSIRKYENKPIEKEKLDTVMKSALLVPSSRGRRPWEFIAVNDRPLLEKLSQCREFGPVFIAEAPMCIVVLADTGISDVWVEDCSIAASYIQLTAQSLGLGSCWVQVRERLHKSGIKAGDYIKEVLGIPENYDVECIIVLGYPAENKKPYEESELLFNKIHYNGF